METTHWMDRVRSSTSGDAVLHYTSSPRQPSFTAEIPQLIAARRGLSTRKSITQLELMGIAQTRHRQEVAKNARLRVPLAITAVVVGSATSVAGSLFEIQTVLLVGFVIALFGLLSGARILASFIDPDTTQLSRYLTLGEAHAESEDVCALSRAVKEDPELATLVAPWWSDSAPIRQQDLALVAAYQKVRGLPVLLH